MTSSKLRLNILILISFTIISCVNSKSSLHKTISKYQKEGYATGTITPKSKGNCGWIITDSKNNSYDPINIEEEKFIQFSLKKENIYFKFLPLRMKNRCKNTSPISLVEIILAPN
jgi:hypothetical protein